MLVRLIIAGLLAFLASAWVDPATLGGMILLLIIAFMIAFVGIELILAIVRQVAKSTK